MWIGQLSSIQSGNASTQFPSYDVLGRPTAQVQTVGTVTAGNNVCAPGQTPSSLCYSYYRNGTLASETYPSGRTIAYGADTAGRVSQIGVQNGTLVYAQNVKYAPHGAVWSMQLGNGLYAHTYFDANRNQPLHIGLGTTNNGSWSNSNATQPTDFSVLNLAYTYGGSNNNGNVQSQTITVGANSWTQGYVYDAVNRLYQATESGSDSWSQTFHYDPFGNYWVEPLPGDPLTPASLQWTVPQNGTSSTNNQFQLSNCVINGSSAAAYDPAGNQQCYGGYSLYYDAENRQKQAVSSGLSATYVYDGFGHRVQSVINGATNTYIYDVNGDLVAEYSTQIPSDPSGTTKFFTQDALGSTRVTTDTAGGTVNRFDYLPFGKDLYTTNRTTTLGYGAVPPRQRFTGKERDSETGLDYFGARYLSSAEGRFTSPDAFGGHYSDPQTLNRYTYVRNNPLRFTDPTGHDLQEVCTQTKENKSTCGGSGREKHVGTTDEKGKFHVTHFQTDSSGNLDGHNVSFNTGGIHIDGNKAEFVSGTDPTRVNGEAGTPWASTHFVANSDCGGTCEAGGAIFGAPKDLSNLVHSLLIGPNMGLDAAGDHEGEQWRGGNKEGPDMHLSFILGQGVDAMHFDNRYPYGSAAGFLEHTKDWLNPAGHKHVDLPKDIMPVPQQ